MGRTRVAIVLLGIWGAGCAPAGEAEPGRNGRDGQRGGLFGDFLDGKYDSAGHPLGAQVYQAEESCRPETGEAEAEGWGAWPDGHAAGLLCRVATRPLTGGQYVLNLRALTQTATTCEVEDDQELLEVRIKDSGGSELATKRIQRSAFREAMTYQNLPVSFSASDSGALTVEVEWLGTAAVRLDYLEIFPSERRVVIAPPSGVLAKNAALRLELANPPAGARAVVSCDGAEQDVELQREEGEFLTTLQAPASEALAGCSLPSRLKVEMKSEDWVRATSRVTYLAEEPACSFEPGQRRVLLTGFEPFPADSSSDNSSERAVLGFDAAALPGVSVMRLLLPVEWDTAAAMVARVVDRCKPELVVSFGQGREQVDIETTAHNAKDSTELAGGTPDNRGIIAENEPIAKDGPKTLATGLPVSSILAGLKEAEITAQASDDAGRYICNNVFYTLMSKISSRPVLGGFVHLPRIARVDASEQKMLQDVVRVVVQRSLQKPEL